MRLSVRANAVMKEVEIHGQHFELYSPDDGRTVGRRYSSTTRFRGVITCAS
jgi:hypothetical protein